MPIIYLHTGSNIGDELKNLEIANKHINDTIGQIIRASNIYKTQAWGNTNQDDFFNQALEVDTDLKPEEVLNLIFVIEKKMGRLRKEKWGKRLIDIDILFYGNKIIKSEKLIIPHPFLQNRNFVLMPLCELIPDFIHPVLKKNIKTLLENSRDELEVEVFSDKDSDRLKN